jgi:flagellar biogenesis protein FliO
MNKYLFSILSAFIFFAGFTGTLSAQVPKEKTPIEVPLPPELREAETSDAGESRFMAEFFNMMLVLGLIVIVLYVSSWMFRRMVTQRTMNINESSNIKVLEQRSLSTKSALYVIEVFGKKMIISESLNGVKFLTTLSKDAETSE